MSYIHNFKYTISHITKTKEIILLFNQYFQDIIQCEIDIKHINEIFYIFFILSLKFGGYFSFISQFELAIFQVLSSQTCVEDAVPDSAVL